MATYADIFVNKATDETITIGLNPATDISLYSLQFSVRSRFGGESGFIIKSVTSGYSASSGITITNSGQGVMNIQINATDTSGLQTGIYSYDLERINSGSRAVITQGFFQITAANTP
jgi:tRNA threonylcarbamoyladenosine modification (KEOPS) complex  Pcc1 subunit